MKKVLYLPIFCMLFALLSSCTSQSTERVVRIVVSNPNDYNLEGVVQGVSLSAVLDSVRTQDASNLTLLDEQGQQVCTQLFDNGEQRLLLFECSVLAQGESSYTLLQKSPLSAEKLAITDEIRRGMDLRSQIDQLKSAITTARWDSVPLLQHQSDSLVQLLDASVLGGYAHPYPGASLRNPWLYRQMEVLAEGPLMCAYQLTYDTLHAQSDTLVEHRTLAMQRGSNLTIVRLLLENAGHQDTLLQCNQIAVGHRCFSSDSLLVDETRSYLAIQRSDSSAIGLFAAEQAGSLRSAENRLAAFLLPIQPDSLLSYYSYRDAARHDSLSLQKAQQELLRMHDAPLTVRISVLHR